MYELRFARMCQLWNRRFIKMQNNFQNKTFFLFFAYLYNRSLSNKNVPEIIQHVLVCLLDNFARTRSYPRVQYPDWMDQCMLNCCLWLNICNNRLSWLWNKKSVYTMVVSKKRINKVNLKKTFQIYFNITNYVSYLSLICSKSSRYLARSYK